MANVKAVVHMNAGVVYAPYIPMTSPMLEVDPNAEFRFKVELSILKFKVVERTSEWANKSTHSNN